MQYRNCIFITSYKFKAMIQLTKWVSLIGLFCVLVLLTNCGSKKYDTTAITLSKDAPFTIEDASFQRWMAGTKEGGSGFKLSFVLDNVSSDTQINKVFFRNRETPLHKNGKKQYKGSFKIETNDVVMSSDVIEEAKNTPPEKIPFQLSDTDAVISYHYQGLIYYYKISDLEEKDPIAYPGNPNTNN